jgi:prophage antirepressor-like protein
MIRLSKVEGEETMEDTKSAMATLFNFKADANAELVPVDVRVEEDLLLFRASDVAKCLGYANPAKLVELLGEDNLPKRDVIDTSGRQRQVPFLTEKQLYKGILKSNAKNAEPFQDWVAGEVLPSIRKTGGYLAPGANPMSFFEGMTSKQIIAFGQTKAQAEAAQRDAQLAQAKLAIADAEKERALAVVAAQAPKVEVYDRFIDSSSLMTMQETANVLGTGRTRLFTMLRERGIIQPRQTTPYQRFVDSGYFEVKVSVDQRGYTHATTRVTSKGLEYIKKVVSREVQV